MNNGINVGDSLRFSHSHLFEMVRFNCRVYKVDANAVYFRVPDRARNLAFPPFNGWQNVRLPLGATATAAHAAWKARQNSRQALNGATA